jgi:hypothetical protein
MNSPTGSVESSVVRITSIYPFPRRSLDHALDREEIWSGDSTSVLRRGKVYARRKGVVSLG